MHYVPKPPPTVDISRLGVRPRGAPRRAPTNAPHHWAQGPQDVERTKRGWRFRWYLDRAEGASRATILRAIYAVINHPRGWERTGVRFVRTMDRASANILLRIAPAAESACGPGSAGCYCDNCESKPVAHVGSEYLGKPGAFALILNMELQGHGCFRMVDSYSSPHQPYTTGGVMGTWEDAERTGYMPSDAEIEGAKLWLNGEVPAERIHDD